MTYSAKRGGVNLNHPGGGRKLDAAVFGGGCFWCTEAVFQRVNGVKKVMPGYAGGATENPDYRAVSRGDTGHAEVVKIEYDPTDVSFEKLLEIFWQTHDPTTPNRQGADVDPQYRSIILWTNEAQKRAAGRKKTDLENSGVFKKPIVTEIRPLEKFYPAETEHHDYFANHPTAPYCRIVIAPKIAKVEKWRADNQA